MRFNPPPNWPIPPGWTPGPSQQIDPAWPPAPAGWQFWVADEPDVAPFVAASTPERVRSRRPVLIAIAGLVVLAVVAGVAVWLLPDHDGATGTVASSPGAPEVVSVPTVLILDASGSMTQDDAPGPRIDAAKAAAKGLVDALPDNATLALLTYGTSTGSSDAEHDAGCADVKTLIPLGPLNRDQMRTGISGLTASGYTPISLALRTAVGQLPADDSAQAIVLVSDGEDTCGAPPCDEATQAKRTHPNLAISTIGFKTDGPASDQLRCIADATGGLFVQAANANQLAARLLATQNVASAQTALTSDGLGGIPLGTALADIRAAHPDFPDAAATGSVTVVWRDCDFGFVDGILDSIAPHDGGHTIDGVHVGTPLSRAAELYGDPILLIDNPDGSHSVLFTADPATLNAFRVLVGDYVSSGGSVSGTVKTIVLCRCKPKPVDPNSPMFAGWGAHGRSLDLKPDGTGTWSESSGAANYMEWTVKWTGDPSGTITITRDTRTQLVGDMPDHQPGEQYSASIGRWDNGELSLDIQALSGIDHDKLCTSYDYGHDDPSNCGV